MPLLASLLLAQRKAKKAGVLAPYKSAFQQHGYSIFSKLFWQLDVIGIILMIAVFALILVPFTLAGGVKETWKTAHIIAPLVIGICCIPVFVIWESKCKYPLIPFALLKDRGVWSGFGVAMMLNCGKSESILIFPVDQYRRDCRNLCLVAVFFCMS